MSKFKVGDRVKGTGGCTAGRLATVTMLTDDEDSGEGVHFRRDDDGHTCWEPSYNFELDKSLDNLSIDDVVVDDCDQECTIAGVAGRMVFLEDSRGHEAGVYTVKELKDGGWTVKGAEPEVTELTLQQIADKLAMPVEQLRIKE